MGAQAAELAALALAPVVDYQFRHDVGQGQLDRAHRSIGDYKGALLDPTGLQERRRLVEPRGFDHDVGPLHATLPIPGRRHLLAEIATQSLGKAVAALLTTGMNADLIKIEEMVEQPHVPVGRSARADMAEDFRVLAGEIF